MSKRPIIGHHLAMSPSFVLRDNESLVGKHIIAGGAMYGRVLFTEPSPMVHAIGENIQIKHNIIEVLAGHGPRSYAIKFGR